MQADAFDDTRELVELSHRLRAIEAEIVALEQYKKDLRAAITSRVVALGGKATTPDYTMTIVASTEYLSYDAATISTIIVELLQAGNQALAERLSACGITYRRAGGLRLTLNKEG